MSSSMLAAASSGEGRDLVDGYLIQFNDNGAWCWYQDERVIIDEKRGLLIAGSAASQGGVGGPAREGHIEAVNFDLRTRRGKRHFFHQFARTDDHDVPAFLVLPDGNYLAKYCCHYDQVGRYRIFDGQSWGEERHIDWNSMAEEFEFLTYANLFNLSGEKRIYNISRAHRRSPNIIVSDDLGETWSHIGLLTAPPGRTRGYVNGYFKYCSNGVDRIDFIATEAHPRDYNTSIYHGYIKGGRSYNTFGKLIGEIRKTVAPPPEAFTPVAPANTAINGIHISRLWNNDIHIYEDGTIAALLKARANDNPDQPSNDPEHIFLYSRFDGSEWKTSYLGRAGRKLYNTEQDYTGLGALHPNDPSTIFISTPLDPRDDRDLGVHEIFRGRTTDNGGTWDWRPITRNSTRDNLRPIVPYWSADKTALLWWRGTYAMAQGYDAAVVGLIDRADEKIDRMVFIKADENNTTHADGTPLAAADQESAKGATNNRWRWRAGFGQGGRILASPESGGEDAPLLRTSFAPEKAGAYDIWVNFWSNPNEDWRIRAGLAEDEMQIFRHMASQQVEPGMHKDDLILTGEGNVHLYQAYLGRVYFNGSGRVEVFVDDYPIATGTENQMGGPTVRTCYDGISHARVHP